MRAGGRWLTAALGAGVALGVAGAAAATDPILPLDQVTPGMRGEALTVVRGSQISSFPVEVIDVQHSADAPGGAQILARAEGPLMEETGGVVSGMSGSPVYVTGPDGVRRVIGAVAYGTGDRSGLVVGLTPIEQMLESSAGTRAFEHASATTAARGRPHRRAVTVGSRAAALRTERTHPDRVALYPLARWSVSGISRPAVAPLTDALARQGMQLTAIGPRTARPAQTLVPGATMAVLLSGGDFTLGSIGTVTWVDGAQVVGIGHPILRSGRSRMLLSDGHVYGVIANPIAASGYKYAEAGTILGAVTSDRADGITARLGPSGGIPVVSSAHNQTRNTRSTVRATLAPDERLLPLVSALAQVEPVIRTADGVTGGTLTLRYTIESPDLRRPLVFRNTFAAYGDVMAPSAEALSSIVAALTQNGLRAIPISRIRITQSFEHTVRAARVVSAKVVPSTVRPGQTATLRLTIQPWRQTSRVISRPIRIPKDLRPGARSLRVVPHTGAGFDPAVAGFEDELGLAREADTGAMVARVDALARSATRPQRARDTRVSQIVRVLQPYLREPNDAVRVLGPGDRAANPSQGQVLTTGLVMWGDPVGVRIRVRR